MLPADFLPLKREDSELYKFKPTVDSSIHNISRREEMSQRKSGLSFMIEDILGDSRNKKEKTRALQESPSPPCKQCSSSATEGDTIVSRNTNSYSEHLYTLTKGPSRLLQSKTSAFVPPLSPSTLQTRYGYYSPAVASSPPFTSRTSDVFTFFPCEFSEQHMQANYFRQENLPRSPLYSPPIILDLSNYGPKPSTTRIPVSPVLALQNANAECSGSRQIIWKHINRTPAKRKGGQIRFTNEQTTTLENTFSEHKYLSSSERKRLATALRLSERQVKTWFQNRRAKWRRIKQDPSCRVSSSESEDCNPSNETSRLQDCQFSNSDEDPLSTFE